MALPSSGPISLSDVAGEVGDSTTSNISLGKLSIYDLGDTPLTGYPLGSGFHGWADGDRTDQLQAAGRVGNTTGTSIANRMVVLPADEPTPEIREISLGKSWSVNFWIKADWSMTGTNQLKNQGRYIMLLGTAADGIHPNYSGNLYNNNFRVYYDALQNRFTVGFLADDTSGNPKYTSRQWVMHQLNSGGMTVTGLSSSTTSTNWWGATSRGNVNDNDFTMMTITFDGSSAFSSTQPKMYWNGGSMGTSGVGGANGTPICDTTSPRGIAYLGAPYSNNGTFTQYAGSIGGNQGTTIMDHVSIFKGVLTSNEISSLYNSGDVGGVMPSENDSNLITYYSFNTNTQNVDNVSNSRPVFPVKQSTYGYGGLQISGSSTMQTGTNQAIPVSLTSFLYDSEGFQSSHVGACNAESTEDTAYHDGSGTYPAIGDHVYTDSAGTTSLTTKFYKQADGDWFRMALSGGETVVTQRGEC